MLTSPSSKEVPPALNCSQSGWPISKSHPTERQGIGTCPGLGWGWKGSQKATPHALSPLCGLCVGQACLFLQAFCPAALPLQLQTRAQGPPPPVGLWKHFLPVTGQSTLCQVPSCAGGLSLDTCHLFGGGPERYMPAGPGGQADTWDRMDGYEPRRRCWRIG